MFYIIGDTKDFTKSTEKKVHRILFLVKVQAGSENKRMEEVQRCTLRSETIFGK